MKKAALVLSLMLSSVLGGCSEGNESVAEQPKVVDQTRTRIVNTDSEKGQKGKKHKKSVCKNGRICTVLDDGNEFCITPIVPCKEK